MTFPALDAIRANRARLGDLVVTTPVRRLVDDAVARAVGERTELWLKEELFQRTGSFKPRGALSVMLDDVRQHPPTVMVPAHGQILADASVPAQTEQLLSASI